MKTEPNQGAFASMSQWDKQIGLTKREYFAAMAMQGLLANSEWMQEYEGGKYLMHNEVISEVSVNLADALINALNKEQ